MCEKTNIVSLAIVQSLFIHEHPKQLNILSKLLDVLETETQLNPEEIAISLQTALDEVENGQTKPILQLWNDLESESSSEDELLQFFQPGRTYEIWSPMTTHEAAWQLAKLLEQDEENLDGL